MKPIKAECSECRSKDTSCAGDLEKGWLFPHRGSGTAAPGVNLGAGLRDG